MGSGSTCEKGDIAGNGLLDFKKNSDLAMPLQSAIKAVSELLNQML